MRVCGHVVWISNYTGASGVHVGGIGVTPRYFYLYVHSTIFCGTPSLHLLFMHVLSIPTQFNDTLFARRSDFFQSSLYTIPAIFVPSSQCSHSNSP